MNDTNKKIDKLLNEDWHKNFRTLSIVFAIFLFCFLCYLAFSSGDTINVKANVTGFQSQSSESGENYYLVTKLESGQVIIVKAPREVGIKKGDTVVINRRTTNFFGLTSYSFNMVATRDIIQNANSKDD
ncbi:MAG: hypothetical protein GY694_17390 [Gammaproteobacteria bacterium]|nr:hypothetical protein [Gammaproteobacteria bacterium]